MDWTAFSDPRAFPRLVAVAVMLAAAAALVWMRPRNHAHRGFAIFLSAFGLAVFCNTMGAFAAAPAKEAWFTWTKHFEFLEIPGLLYFMASYPRRRPFLGSATTRTVLLALLAAATLAIEVLLFVDPSVWVSSAHGQSGLAERVGPVNALTKDNVWMAVAALVLAVDYGRIPAGPRRSSLLLVWLGIAINVAYDSASASIYRLQNAVALPESFWNQAVYYLNNAALAIAGLAVAVMAWQLARSRDPQARGARWTIGLSLPLPVVAAILEDRVAGGVELFDSPFKLIVNGLVRLSLALLPMYALARYRVLDIDVAVKTSVRRGIVVAIFATTAVAGVVGMQQLLAEGPAYVGLLAALALLPFLGPLRNMADRAAAAVVPEGGPDAAYIEERKLGLYRAAIEEALLDRRRGAGHEDAFLRELRHRLGVTPAEHRALVAMARSGRDPVPDRLHVPARFEPLRELGRGSQGAAILARDAVLDRTVVLKRPLGSVALDPGTREAWLREARTAARVQHPNVVTLLEVVPDGDPPTLVLEHVPGGSLRQLLDREGRLDPDRALRLAADTARGLAAVHGAGIVHRDLKPANILVTPDGSAKITDFGVARPPPGAPRAPVLAAPGSGTEGTQTADLGGPGVGSLLYMAPEQVDHDSVDGRADLYALGAILVEMVAGHPALRLRGLDADAMRDAVRTQPPDLAGVPAHVAAIAQKALAKDPAGRYPDAAGMLSALEAARRAPTHG
jgi:hypothetical protein